MLASQASRRKRWKTTRLIAQQLEGVGDPFEKQRGVGPRRPSRHPLAARSISMSRPFPLLNETVTYY
jgi:hypothetical protein